MERNRRAAIEAAFECPKESTEVLERWGWVGYSRSCVAYGVEHGPWAAWENDTNVRGHYLHGKQEGEWQWFDRGSLTRTIRYTAGTEAYESRGDNASSFAKP